jgi:hypothetical protein
MMPGMPEKRTHDYVRHGTTSLFAAFNTADGTVISSIHRRHRAIEFNKFLTKIDLEVPDDLDIHLVCDNYGTHKTPTCSNAPTTAASKPSRKTSGTGSRTGIRTRNPSSGPKPPNRSSTHSNDFSNGLPAQDTRVNCARIRQARRLFDRQSVHVGAHQHDRAVPVLQNTDHARRADRSGPGYGRRLLSPVRISLIRISGCSKAAKCPPLSASP